MTLIQALVLGAVQGLTEFIPISSSGHLVLTPWLFGWENPGLAFDAVLHLGTLLAVLAYFREAVFDLTVAWIASVREQDLGDDPRRTIAWLIIVGTVPAATAGYLFQGFFERLFEAPFWAAVFLLVTGALLAVSESIGERWRRMEEMNIFDAAVVGVAQALAIAPGISRSGATIAAGLIMGLEREDAARFSFLLAMPAIFGAGILELGYLMTASFSPPFLLSLSIGFLAAAITGYLAIAFLLDFLQGGRLYVFAAYCWIVGLGVLARFML